jgi:hypothetical protein
MWRMALLCILPFICGLWGECKLEGMGLVQEAKEIGDEFLALEKYVNLNYLVSGAQTKLNLNMRLLVSCGQYKLRRHEVSNLSMLCSGSQLYWVPCRAFTRS